MRTVIKSGIALAVSSFVVACGGGGTTASSGDTGATGSSSARVSSSTPAMNATGVRVDQDVTLNFSEAVDASSVTSSTIVVMPMEPDQEHEEGSELDMQRITGTFSTTGSAVKFITNVHYERGQDYSVSVNGVKSTSGTRFARAMISFRTRENPRTKEIRYQNTGALRDTTISEYNATGLLVKEARTDAVGALIETEIYEYDGAGDMTKETETNGLGAITEVTRFNTALSPLTLPAAPAITAREIDFDANNAVTGYSSNFRDGNTTIARLSFSGSGVNAIWDFTDDILSSAMAPAQRFGNVYISSRYNPATTPSNATWNPTTRFTNPALVLRSISGNVVDSFERTLYEITYTNLGGNQVVDLDTAGNPSPVDDVVRSYTRRDYDVNGRRYRTVNFSATNGGPGIDGKWFTGDDVVTGLSVREFDGMSMLTRSVNYRGAGLDGNWFQTSDNDVSTYTIYDYDMNMNRSRARDYTAGADLRIGGIDDILTEDTTYDTSR